MSLVAALAAAIFAYLAAGALVGRGPGTIRLRGRRPRPGGARQWLAEAGARMTVAQFWAASVAMGAVCFAIVAAVTATPTVALVPAALMALAPRAYYARERARRARGQVEAWPDALRNVIASLGASLSLHQALVALGFSGPAALRPTFRRYALLARTLDARAALEAVRDDLADPVSDRVIEVLILATERGPSIVVDILADLARATTADLQLAERIATAQLEQRLNARAVFVLPYFILVVVCASAAPIRTFYRSPAGLAVVLVGAAMSTVGMVVIGRLGRLPGEERLFVAAEQRR